MTPYLNYVGKLFIMLDWRKTLALYFAEQQKEYIRNVQKSLVVRLPKMRID